MFSEPFLPNVYCILNRKTCGRNRVLLEPVTRLRFDHKRDLLTPKSHRCCRFVRVCSNGVEELEH